MTDEKEMTVPAEDSKAGSKRKAGSFFRGKKGKKHIQILVVLIVVACIVAGCVAGARKQLNQQIGGSYLVNQVVRQDLRVAVSESATLAPADEYHITTMLSGEILKAPAEEDQEVQKGDLLFALDSSDVRNNVTRAGLSVQQAELSYSQAQEALHPTATITGTIREVLVHNGQAVQPGTPLAKLASDMDISADFLFPFADPAEFWVGQSATIFINGVAGTVTGTVSQVSDETSVTPDGKICASVRVKLQNPGALSDSLTCSAVIGSYCSYGDTPLSMAGNSLVTASDSGTVTGFTKLAGSTVKQGETLCTIESDNTRNQLENARLNLESVRLSADSSSDALDDYNITAPITGTLVTKNFKTGDKVEGAASGELAVLYDLSHLKLQMMVHELDIGKVAVGQKVEITADALEGQTFTGVVDRISISGVTAGGSTSYPVTVLIQDYGELRPGMTVSANILGDEVNNVLCIPVDAVSRGNQVLVPGPGAMSEDGKTVVDASKIETREVKLGRNDEVFIEVLEGLEEGDVVLTANQASSMMDMMMGAY